MGDISYNQHHPNQAGGQELQYNQPCQFIRKLIFIRVLPKMILYRHLRAIRARSNQQQVFIGLWATFFFGRCHPIKRGGKNYSKINHTNLSGNISSFCAAGYDTLLPLWAVCNRSNQ
jgi:hypothetical protein